MAEAQAKKKPVGIMDTTLRDGHQSLLATRMRWEDMEQIAAKIEAIGFAAVEVWGGATFDVAHRFLGEDPWERATRLKKLMPTTPFSMLLRGQNLVGYRNYADDVVKAFCYKAAEVGIDRFRVFDALNDTRNFETAYEALKQTGKHIQGTLCFSLTERKMGGPVFNLQYYLDLAKRLQDMGSHSLVIKDMAGIISPFDAFELVSALKEAVDLPLQIHTHYTSGMGSMVYLKAIEAGVDIIDCAISPFALRTSQPASEPFVQTLAGTDRDTGLSLTAIVEVAEMIERFAGKYRHLLTREKMSVIDANVLIHQIPGGMASNMINQLRDADRLDQLQAVYDELPRTRKALGTPPLVTPTSQIVGTQAVMNVIAPDGPWTMVSKEVKDLLYGLYGRTPRPVDPEVQKRVLEGYERGTEPITVRPGEVLEPELEKAKADVADLTTDMGDVLIYALYPRTGRRFLEAKYGKIPRPAEWTGKTIEQVRAEDELLKKALAGELIAKDAVAGGVQTGAFDVDIDGEHFTVKIAPADPSRAAGLVAQAPAVSAPVAAAPASAAAPTAATPTPAAAAPAAAGEGQVVVAAPMPGTVIRFAKAAGDAVKKGELVLVLEAMKMENSINSPADGTVAALSVAQGDNVQRGQAMMVIDAK